MEPEAFELVRAPIFREKNDRLIQSLHSFHSWIDMEKFHRRWNYFYTNKNHVKGPLECLCDASDVSYCESCETISIREICAFNSRVDRKNKTKVWDSNQQSEFIHLLENSNPSIIQRGADAIWATVVLRQAYKVGDWAVDQGFTSFEYDHHCDEDDEMYVPYDASRWSSWIKSALYAYRRGGGDVSIDKNHIKQVAAGMVLRKFIKIPMNSGLPLYYWFLEGYTQYDFCSIYGCLEFIDPNEKVYHFHTMEICMRDHMKHAITAKTGFKLRTVMYMCSTGDEFEDEYTVKVMEKVYFMYKNRKECTAATRIQSIVRAFLSKRRVDEFTLRPEQLFDTEHTSVRKRKFGIEDWRFGQ